ncbi:MAG: hypothetical protein ACQESH_07340 [Campylobacterota bacterium]
MPQSVIEKIRQCKTYHYNPAKQRVVNLNGFAQSDIDEFLYIQHLLDRSYIPYRFEKDFHIQILNL